MMMIAIRFTALTFLLAGLIYPLTITFLGQTLFPDPANGSLLTRQDGQIIGSSLLGQPFTRPEYFHPRPSVNGYDGANSGGTNWGATNQKLFERVQKEASSYRQTNQWSQAVPVDAVTASASNLDPDISLANALAQVPRVAATRGIPTEIVRQLVLASAQTTFSESPYINVLNINLALDRLSQSSKTKEA